MVVLYSVSLIPFGLNFRNIITESYYRIDAWIIILAGIIGFYALSKIIIYTAKTFKEAESKKEHKASDLFLEIFLICFFILGVWTIQPRLNKIINEI